MHAGRSASCGTSSIQCGTRRRTSRATRWTSAMTSWTGTGITRTPTTTTCSTPSAPRASSWKSWVPPSPALMPPRCCALPPQHAPAHHLFPGPVSFRLMCVLSKLHDTSFACAQLCLVTALSGPNVHRCCGMSWKMNRRGACNLMGS